MGIGNSFAGQRPSPKRRNYRSKSKWGPRPGKAWEPKSRRQERKYRSPRAFSVRNEWRYSESRTEEREKSLKKSAKTMLNLNTWFNNLGHWFKVKVLRQKDFKPARIDPDRYIVEVE